MKYLGIDYGAKRVGIAVSNPEGTIAFPRETLSNDARLVDRIIEIANREGIERAVVGDTRSFGARENPVTEAAETFIASLTGALHCPVLPAFEAGSSIEASRYAPETKAHDDAAAAAIILQRYLDMHGSRVE